MLKRSLLLYCYKVPPLLIKRERCWWDHISKHFTISFPPLKISEQWKHGKSSRKPMEETICWSKNSSPLPPVPAAKFYFPASLASRYIPVIGWVLADVMSLPGPYHLPTWSLILLHFCLACMEKTHRETLRALDWRAFTVSWSVNQRL